MLTCTRHCSHHFTEVFTYLVLTRKVVHHDSSPFYRWRNLTPGRLRHLLKVIQSHTHNPQGFEPKHSESLCMQPLSPSLRCTTYGWLLLPLLENLWVEERMQSGSSKCLRAKKRESSEGCKVELWEEKGQKFCSLGKGISFFWTSVSYSVKSWW